MAINSCSINAFTINSLQCRRRELQPPGPVQEVFKSHPQQIRWNNDIEYNFTEKSHIKISILLKGHLLEEIIENNIHSITPLIRISDILINTKEPNITIDTLNIWNN